DATPADRVDAGVAGGRLRGDHRRRPGAMVGRLLSDLAGPRGSGRWRDALGDRTGGRRRSPGRMTDRLGRAHLHLHSLASDRVDVNATNFYPVARNPTLY